MLSYYRNVSYVVILKSFFLYIYDIQFTKENKITVSRHLKNLGKNKKKVPGRKQENKKEN